MKITEHKIRKVNNREEYRVSFKYVTSKGTKRSVSFLAFSRAEATHKLNFRLAGLANGGAKFLS